MNYKQLYPMIFKRKSFHFFKDRQGSFVTESITADELKEIEAVYKTLTPLIPDIRTEIRIVPQAETKCKRGAEYCILFYSETCDNYRQNIGYLGEQLDLYLASKNIGTLWYGIEKRKDTYQGLDYVIMIGIAKVPEDKFRKDMFKSKRKILDEIWQGEAFSDIGNIVRFAPSACNTQPWFVEAEEKELKVYRYKKEGKRGIMPAAKVAHYNRMDIGIFLLFLEVCLAEQNISFERQLFGNDTDDNVGKVLVATYQLP